MLPIDSKPALASIHGLHTYDQLALTIACCAVQGDAR